MLTVPKLEMHLAHACNLRCEGCAHYSNYGFPGVVALEDGGPWLRAWSARLRPVHFTFLGGEPLLNPALVAWLDLARELLPHTRLRLVSNGLLLHRWPTLWSALARTSTRLTISVHSSEPGYQQRLRAELAPAREAAARAGVELELRNSIDDWVRLYRGHGAAMEPFDDGEPATSWGACASRHCVTLQDNALWKCPPLAHLPRVAARFALASRPAWRPYLAYRPLQLDASDEELAAFYARGPEPSCGMCPARPEHFEKSVS